MAGFIAYLSSEDCTDVFPENSYIGFRVQTPKYYHLPTERRFGCTNSWTLALTDISLTEKKPPGTGGFRDSMRAFSLPTSVAVLCDLACDSFIGGGLAPVLRIIHPASEPTRGSLALPFYVKLEREYFNTIHIWLRNSDLSALDRTKWPKPEALKLTCTLHFQQV